MRALRPNGQKNLAGMPALCPTIRNKCMAIHMSLQFKLSKFELLSEKLLKHLLHKICTLYGRAEGPLRCIVTTIKSLDRKVAQFCNSRPNFLQPLESIRNRTTANQLHNCRVCVCVCVCVCCLLYTSPSPRDRQKSRMPSSA